MPKITPIIFILSLFILSFLTQSCTQEQNMESDTICLVPSPQKFEKSEGTFKLSDQTSISSPLPELSKYFVEQLKEISGFEINQNSENAESKISLEIDTTYSPGNPEVYELDITGNEITLKGNSAQGVFRGMQTIFQLIPPVVKADKNYDSVGIPCSSIMDEPAFKWRGLNLDCGRHFMSKDFIKRYIDILAYYKFNTFHWHLTEDQGWRIEIKKYPKLTEVGAWRKEADGSTYGGFYTQEDIKEVVAYAKSRYINIVPEIEMPGHSLASLAAYPENSCTGGPFEVTNLWGVHKDIYCAGRDSTFIFLQNVLDEVIDLFPGKYIHIGGDEAPKDRWEKCPRCQARIKEEGLKNEHELQSYFITRISKYLHSKGKEVIGWDEILEGGLAPGAIVQSWRGVEGALEAARKEHYTIYSPTSHTYFNSDPDNVDLRIAYSFNPVPKELTEEESKYVLGSEANMWTEQAPQETIDSKLFPRLLALSEVLWTAPKDKDYDEFHDRVQCTYDDLTALGIEYGRETKTMTPKTTYNEEKNEFSVEIIQGQTGIDIFYTLDGSQPTPESNKYTKPVTINKTTTLNIAAFKNDRFLNKEITLAFDFHKALNSNITLKNSYNERYRAGGSNALIDGVIGTNDFHDGNWQGYLSTDIEAVIDFGKEKEITEVTPRFMLNSNSYVFLPEKVTIWLSNDNKTFTDEITIDNDIPQKNSEILVKEFKAEYGSKKARYIKVKTESVKECPAWHPGAGSPAWTFIDEIIVK